MKKNTIIWTAASAISALSAPLVYWGVKAAIKKNSIEKITEAVKKEIQIPVKVFKQEEPVEPSKEKKATQKKTEEGRKIYTGAKGGRYTLGENGQKHYLKN